jgi:hypothetical protein
VLLLLGLGVLPSLLLLLQGCQCCLLLLQEHRLGWMPQ